MNVPPPVHSAAPFFRLLRNRVEPRPTPPPSFPQRFDVVPPSLHRSGLDNFQIVPKNSDDCVYGVTTPQGCGHLRS
ncbi:hypothetical protein P8C59_001075 [Phyllachora maydis]|uniref:Uncharacterized protein n=1 Tax=Phyllachora maydis TaxID=1825666 RepID=A0AAD9HXG7_9PEZI|nr:hypothetical protein P8C59_001075 [Phyllachora maydis]